MFDRIGDIQLVSVHARGHERFVQQPARRPDEGRARLVLLIAGLFADQHEVGVGRSGTEYCLGRIQVQVAAFTAVRGV